MTAVGRDAAAPAASLRDHLAVLRRRRWAIVQALVLVPAAAVAFSLQQEPLYEAEAEVLLSRQNLASALTGTPDPTAYQQADRLAQTQASLAAVPEVAQRVLAELGLHDRTPLELLEASDVTAKQNADILVFRVTDPLPWRAERLATEYAREFTNYRRELDTAALAKAREEVQAKLRELESAGQGSGPLYASLAEKEQQLSTMEALQTSNAFLVRAADSAEQVQPRPVRNGILALALGLVLGIGIAFLWEALDTRVRTSDEIGQRLGLPLLARIPEPPRRLRSKDRLVMLADPTGVHAESFRMLRANLDFVRLGRAVRTIMITSAVEREGKSTTAANLAIALARAGQRVILVDLDLRRPTIDRLFKIDADHPGLTHVALGRTSLEEAIVPIAVRGVADEDAGRARRALGRDRHRNGDAAGNRNGNGHHPSERLGSIGVVRAGASPPDAGEFIATDALKRHLESLRQLADIVVVDTPPMLHVGDAMALSASIDAIVVVTRMDVVRRPMLTELRRLLDAAPAAKLGFVVTGARADHGYGYASGYGYGAGEDAPVLALEHVR